MVAGTMVSEDFCWWWSLIRGPQCWLVRWSVKTFVVGGRFSVVAGTMVSEDFCWWWSLISGGWYDGQ